MSMLTLEGLFEKLSPKEIEVVRGCLCELCRFGVPRSSRNTYGNHWDDIHYLQGKESVCPAGPLGFAYSDWTLKKEREAERTVRLECGCVVIKGNRCPTHGAP